MASFGRLARAGWNKRKSDCGLKRGAMRAPSTTSKAKIRGGRLSIVIGRTPPLNPHRFSQGGRFPRTALALLVAREPRSGRDSSRRAKKFRFATPASVTNRWRHRPTSRLTGTPPAFPRNDDHGGWPKIVHHPSRHPCYGAPVRRSRCAQTQLFDNPIRLRRKPPSSPGEASALSPNGAAECSQGREPSSLPISAVLTLA